MEIWYFYRDDYCDYRYYHCYDNRDRDRYRYRCSDRCYDNRDNCDNYDHHNHNNYYSHNYDHNNFRNRNNNRNNLNKDNNHHMGIDMDMGINMGIYDVFVNYFVFYSFCLNVYNILFIYFKRNKQNIHLK